MQWLKLQYDKHIPHETQKGKDIYSKVQAEIDSLYPAVFKKVLRAYSGLIYIFVNNYNVEARCAFLCPPWKRGHIVLQLSVGRSVCRSVDQVLSAQYLLTPSLDQYQTLCRGCPQWVDDPYWFSGHMFKGQGQTTLLSPLRCLLNIFWTLYLINTKLGVGVALNK